MGKREENLVIGEKRLFVFTENIIAAPRDLFQQQLNAETAALVVIAGKAQRLFAPCRRHLAEAAFNIQKTDVSDENFCHARIASSVF